MGGVGRLDGRSVVVIGQQKGDDTDSRIKHNFGMVKLAPEEQQMLVAAEPAMFTPIKGTWGLRGATSVPIGRAHV